MVMPTKMAALGEATAGSIRAAGYQVHFTGNGEPVATAADFVKIAAGAKVLFPQAAHSRSSIEKILHDSIRAVPLVVYDNQAIDCSDLPDYDLLAFTSPLNAGAYWKSHRQQPGQEVYAIGGTTAAALAQLGIKNVVVAEKAGEEGLALAIIKNSYIGGRQKRM